MRWNPIVLDIAAGLGVGQSKHIRYAADLAMQGEIADDAGQAGGVECGYGKMDAGIEILPANPGEYQSAAVDPVGQIFDAFDPGDAGDP